MSLAAIAEHEWLTIVEAAHAHRLTALLDRAVDASPKDVPAPIRAMIKARHREQAAWALAALPPLFEMLDALAANGIAALAWKGPALALECWGDAGARRFSDLDVVVAPAHRDRAREIAGRLGWCARGGISAAGERIVAAPRGAWELERPGTAIQLELHWRFAARRYGGVPATEPVIARSRPITLAGRDVRVPGGADALVLLALHGSKHGWTSLDDVAVFAALSSANPDAVNEASRLASEAGAGRAFALATALASTTLGVGSVPGVGLGAPAARTVSALVDRVRARWTAVDPAWRPDLAWDLAWTAGLARKSRLLWRSLVDPTSTDLREWPLPSAFSPLYHLLRPLRLITRTVVRRPPSAV